MAFGPLELMIGIVVLLAIAYVMMPPRRKREVKEVIERMAAPVQHIVEAAPVERTVHISQRERELLEDGQIIAADYEEAAREEIRRAALRRHRERLIREEAREAALDQMIMSYQAGTSNATASGKSKSSA